MFEDLFSGQRKRTKAGRSSESSSSSSSPRPHRRPRAEHTPSSLATHSTGLRAEPPARSPIPTGPHPTDQRSDRFRRRRHSESREDYEDEVEQWKADRQRQMQDTRNLREDFEREASRPDPFDTSKWPEYQKRQAQQPPQRHQGQPQFVDPRDLQYGRSAREERKIPGHGSQPVSSSSGFETRPEPVLDPRTRRQDPVQHQYYEAAPQTRRDSPKTPAAPVPQPLPYQPSKLISGDKRTPSPIGRESRRPDQPPPARPTAPPRHKSPYAAPSLHPAHEGERSAPASQYLGSAGPIAPSQYISPYPPTGLQPAYGAERPTSESQHRSSRKSTLQASLAQEEKNHDDMKADLGERKGTQLGDPKKRIPRGNHEQLAKLQDAVRASRQRADYYKHELDKLGGESDAPPMSRLAPPPAPPAPAPPMTVAQARRNLEARKRDLEDARQRNPETRSYIMVPKRGQYPHLDALQDRKERARVELLNAERRDKKATSRKEVVWDL